MSSGRPSRRSAIRSSTRGLTLDRSDSHWAIDVGLESTNPGAIALTVIPYGPSSCAVWRVNPSCPAFALA